jgi:hypothetical protein
MKKTLIAVATALTLSASIALAAPANETSYYVGVDLGAGGLLNNFNNGVTGGDNANKTAFVYGFNGGILSPVNSKGFSWGGELGYTQYSEVKVNNPDDITAQKVPVRGKSVNFLGVLKFEPAMLGGFNVIGKAGMAYMMQSIVGGPSPAAHHDANGFVPMFAVGLGYDIPDMPVAVDVTYQYTVGINPNNGTAYTAGSIATQPAYAVLANIKYVF